MTLRQPSLRPLDRHTIGAFWVTGIAHALTAEQLDTPALFGEAGPERRRDGRDAPLRLNDGPYYEGWSDTVRSALVWLNWSDPVDTVANVRVQDPVRQARAAVFSAWANELQPNIGYQTAELVRTAEQYADTERAHPALWDALFAVAAPRNGHNTIDARLLGLWLRDNQGTIAAGHKLAVDRSDSYRPRWKLEPA